MRRILLVLLPLLIVACSSSESGSWREKDNTKEAFQMSQDFMRERLTDPESATFPSMRWNDKVKVERDSDSQRYQVTAYVDSEDAFGGTLRTEYIADLEQVSKGEWLLYDIQVNEY
ncbi:MAG TPA: hypothetical protein ENH10_04070 [Bacteroidetes bacterium]|nr:hypothetical protein [Bacteroidota bacterium]HEX04320.1 hypothetical protein [Bacteroidota bacterium]